MRSPKLTLIHLVILVAVVNVLLLVLGFNQLIKKYDHTIHYHNKNDNKSTKTIKIFDDHQFNYCKSTNSLLKSHNTSQSIPHSVIPEDFMEFSNQRCSQVSDFLNAVKYGTRKWLIPTKGIPDVELSKLQSYFVPHNCDIPMLQDFEICHALNAYEHIFLFGDSLTRHTMQGMYIALSNDLILGGQINDYPDNHQLCQCDGQFSEYQLCRRLTKHFWNNNNPQLVGLCSAHNSTMFSLKFEIKRPRTIDYSQIKCDNSSRPVFVLLQGGVHYQTDSKSTIHHILTPFFDHNNVKHCFDEGQIHVVWASYNAQSRILDEKFPLQARENGLLFNEEMKEYFDGIHNRLGYKVHIIDWWNLTANARTSDGFHYLTDINLVKANHLANLMNIMNDI